MRMSHSRLTVSMNQDNHMDERSASVGSCKGGTSTAVVAVDGANDERVGETVDVGTEKSVGVRAPRWARSGLEG